MKKIKNRIGFTLIEILVALAIVGIVLAGIFSVYRMQHKSYIVQDQISTMQQNERVALQMITRDIKLAGLGLSGCSSTTGGKIIINEDINENGVLDAGEDVNGNGGAPEPYDSLGYDGSDIITVAYYSFSPNGGAGGYTQITGPTGQISSSSVLNVYDNTGFAVNDQAIIISGADPCHYAMIEITGLPAGQLQHNPKLENLPGGIGSGFIENDIVKRVNSGGGGGKITYAINLINGTYQLTRSVDGGAAQPLADNIEDMQIAYGFDTDNDNVVDTWADDPTGQDMTLLREMRVSLVARTEREDPEWNAGNRPAIENHAPATNATEAQYRRRVLQSTVNLRNTVTARF